MSRQMMSKTWTICLIIAITLLHSGLGVPVHKSQGHTTLDVVLEKFPSLNKNHLDPNLVEILDKTCADWQAINSTNSVTKPANALCLVLYESLSTFCSKFGNKLYLYLDYMPSLVPNNFNITIENVCADTNGLYSLKDAEHNISNILQPKPVNCYLLCSSFGNEAAPIIHDACKYSHFFTVFEAAKFLGDIHLRLNMTVNLIKERTVLQNKIKPQSVVAAVPDTALENKAVETPKQTVKDSALDSAKPRVDADAAAQPKAVKGDQKDAEIKVEAPAKNLNLNDAPENAGIVAQKPDALAEKVDSEAEKVNSVAGKADSVAGKEDSIAGKEDSVAGNADLVAGKADALAKKPEKIADAVAQMPAVVAENPLEAEEKKNIPAPKAPNNKNEALADAVNNNSLEGNANQDEMEDEEAEEAALAQEEANGKAEPVMPEETAEIKAPSIKGKPNTVEDDPVSSYNIPEDDMDGDSYFFSYFTVLMCLVIVGYVGYHNRQKILALVLEGKRGKRSGRPARRPNSSNYHKLDSNLEEAISSSCTKNASNVIY